MTFLSFAAVTADKSSGRMPFRGETDFSIFDELEIEKVQLIEGNLYHYEPFPMKIGDHECRRRANTVRV